MSKPSDTIVNLHYDAEELDPLSPQQQFVLSEFKQYKIDSISISENNFVAPNEGIQEQEPSVHTLFGRDRVFELPPELINEIHKENLAHVHYSEGDWSPYMAQWNCTSNLAVVYSGFTLSDEYHFVVHDLLLNTNEDPRFDAHDYYERDDIQYYIDNARYIREQVESELKSGDK